MSSCSLPCLAPKGFISISHAWRPKGWGHVLLWLPHSVVILIGLTSVCRATIRFALWAIRIISIVLLTRLKSLEIIFCDGPPSAILRLDLCLTIRIIVFKIITLTLLGTTLIIPILHILSWAVGVALCLWRVPCWLPPIVI